MSLKNAPDHRETSLDAITDLLPLYEEGFAAWDDAAGKTQRLDRETQPPAVLNDAELGEIERLVATDNYPGMLAMIDRHRTAYLAADNDITRTAERAKYLHLTHIAAASHFTHVNETAVLASQTEALGLLAEYDGDFEQIPSLLKRRYLLAVEEKIAVLISRDHDFARAERLLLPYIAQLRSLDSARYHTDAQIVSAEGNLAICQAELGNTSEACAAFTRAHEAACEGCLTPGSYFAAYINLLTLSQKMGTDPAIIARTIELMLAFFQQPIEDLQKNSDPRARFAAALIQNDNTYAQHVRRDLENALLGCKLQQNAPDYAATKDKTLARWGRDYTLLVSTKGVHGWQITALADELASKRAEQTLLEARRIADGESATKKYREAIRLYEQASLPFHAGEAAFELIAKHGRSLGHAEAKKLFFRYWRFMEDRLDQDVMTVFEGNDDVARHIHAIADSIRLLFGEVGRSDAATFQAALRAAAKHAEADLKADCERKLLTPEDVAALDTDARAAFDAEGLIVATRDSAGGSFSINYSAHTAADVDAAYLLTQPRVLTAVEAALASGQPQEVRHLFVSDDREDAIEQLVIVPHGEQIFAFHKGSQPLPFSGTEQRLLALSVADGLMGSGEFADADIRLRPAVTRGWVTQTEPDCLLAIRAAGEAYWETLGVQQVTHAPYFVYAKTSEGGRDRYLGGTAIHPLEKGELSYPQVFFGDDVFERAEISPERCFEIGSLGVEPLSRKWLPMQIFDTAADFGIENDFDYAIMVANAMVIRWLKKLGVEVHELGNPDIDDPVVQDRLIKKMGWDEQTIAEWKRAYFDRLQPKIVYVSVHQTKDAIRKQREREVSSPR